MQLSNCMSPLRTATVCRPSLCPPGGQQHRSVRGDQRGGRRNQLVLGEQQHHSQHSELRKNTQATQSPADQPTNPAGHHLGLLPHEPLQPLVTHRLPDASNDPGEHVEEDQCSINIRQDRNVEDKPPSECGSVPALASRRQQGAVM